MNRSSKLIGLLAAATSVLALGTVQAHAGGMSSGSSAVSPAYHWARAGQWSAKTTVLHPDPEVGSENALAGRLQMLGQYHRQYWAVFAGVVLDGGRVTVYVVRGHDAGFLRAVTAADPNRAPYTVKFVRHNWLSLISARNWVTTNLSRLEGQGIQLVSWGPDVAANALTVGLTAPGSSQLAQLQRTIRKLRSYTILVPSLAQWQ